MDRWTLVEKIGVLAQDFIVAFIGCILRIVFKNGKSFIETLTIFFGGLLLGSSAAYWAQSTPLFKNFYIPIGIVVGMLTKEIVLFFVNDFMPIAKDVFSTWADRFSKKKK